MSPRMSSLPIGFEEDEDLRSSFMRELIALQSKQVAVSPDSERLLDGAIPLHLIQYWHDEREVPEDVRKCINSWRRLRLQGFRFSMFNDASAATYIAGRFTSDECTAFTRCHHPAMRCDYLRICVLLAEGGLYVDADDVLIGEGWRHLFHDGTMKVQPLCYDIPTGAMLPAGEAWRDPVPARQRIFYVNNDPIVAPPGHPVLRKALARATERLLGCDSQLEIQSTTGPGNLTAVLAAHARNLMSAGRDQDYEILLNWDSIAETKWELSYRDDSRNWRNIPARGDGP